MNIKTLAKANVLQEKIAAQTKVLDALSERSAKFDIWVNSGGGEEYSLNEFVPIDVKTSIIQAAKSAIELELSRLYSQFAQL